MAQSGKVWAITSLAFTILSIMFEGRKKTVPQKPTPEPEPEPEPEPGPVELPKKKVVRYIPGKYRQASYEELPEDIKAEAVRVLKSSVPLGSIVELRAPYAALVEEHSNAPRGVSILVDTTLEEKEG